MANHDSNYLVWSFSILSKSNMSSLCILLIALLKQIKFSRNSIQVIELKLYFTTKKVLDEESSKDSAYNASQSFPLCFRLFLENQKHWFIKQCKQIFTEQRNRNFWRCWLKTAREWRMSVTIAMHSTVVITMHITS